MHPIVQICALWGAIASGLSDSDAMKTAAQPSIFGLVIGYNGTDDPNELPLQFADDDAVKNAQLLANLGAEYVILTELDADSRSLYPHVQAAKPTSIAVQRATTQLAARIEEERANGRPTQLFVFYAGHGDVEHNEGYVHLADRRLRRRDFKDIVTSTRADEIHVIVDACKSYFLVFGRGPGGRRNRALGRFPEEDDTYTANVGFLLSASADQDSHEWEAFQSGVFSHEVRSALRGAADLNLDGSVSYEEAAAFIFAANRSISNPKYRPRFFARAPGGGPLDRSTLIAFAPEKQKQVRVGPGLSQHLYIEDMHGVRLADFHPSESQQVRVVVPAEGPLFLRTKGASLEHEITERDASPVDRLHWRAPMARRRGAEHVAFSRLFSQPFEASSVQAYHVAQKGAAAMATRQRVTTPPPWLQPALVVGAAGMAVAGGVLTRMAYIERGRVGDRTSNLRRAQVNTRIDRYNTTAVLLYALATSLMAAYVTWQWWPQGDTDVKLQGPADWQPSVYGARK